MRTARSPYAGRRPSASRTLIAPAVLASALAATAAVGVLAGGRPVSALSTANQAAVVGGKPAIAKTVVKTAGWRVITTVGPANENVSGTLAVNSAKDGWSVWTGSHYTSVERLVGSEWTRVPIPATLTGYVRSAVAFDGDSASDFWLFNSDSANHALRFAGSKWTLQQIPAWVLPQRSGDGPSTVTTSVFSPDNVWVFGLGAGSYAAHYNGHAWAKVRLPAVPDEVSAVSPDDIWALHGDTAWYGNGKTWTATKIPKAAGNPPEAFANLTVSGRDSAWVWRTILVPGPQTEADVLHWNGTAWQSVARTPADNIDSVAPDGAGGLWATGIDINPSGFNLFYHLARGHWTEVNPPAGTLTQAQEHLTWIPGTHSLWGTATRFTHKGEYGELIKYSA